MDILRCTSLICNKLHVLNKLAWLLTRVSRHHHVYLVQSMEWRYVHTCSFIYHTGKITSQIAVGFSLTYPPFMIGATCQIGYVLINHTHIHQSNMLNTHLWQSSITTHLHHQHATQQHNTTLQHNYTITPSSHNTITPSHHLSPKSITHKYCGASISQHPIT